jgi:hypothetical protein
VLSTFKVNTTLDTVAVDLRTGKDAFGHISLRSAIQAANARPNSDKILLPAGTIMLTLAGGNEDNGATGDLDVRGNVTITGKGAGSTIIDGNNLDRVFQILSGKVQISGVTIQHGRASEGGGILNTGGNVTLTSVAVANNLAIGTNGVRGQDDPVGRTVRASIGGVGGKGSNGGAAFGGGIANQAGSLTISQSAFTANQANGGGGGDGGQGAEAVTQSAPPGLGVIGTSAGGTGGAGGAAGAGNGGGLANFGTASFTGVTVNFGANQAQCAPGGRGGAGAKGTGGDAGSKAGDAAGGDGGPGGASGSGLGGGIFNAKNATLMIDPRLGARKGSQQASATNTITGNKSNRGIGGPAGAGGAATAGKGVAGKVPDGTAKPGKVGVGAVAGTGIGGGLERIPGSSVTIANTNITGNSASTAGNDVSEAALE